jgi:hypothetical protein
MASGHDPRPRLWGPILRETFHTWIERDAFTQSAALAFFALFSMVPVLVLFEVGAGLLFEPSAVRRQIVGEFDLLMGHQQALAVDGILGQAAFEMSGMIARILGIATFVIGTLAVFVQLQDSLNRMWDVAPKPGPLIRRLLWKRVISFALVLALGFVPSSRSSSRPRSTRSSSSRALRAPSFRALRGQQRDRDVRADDRAVRPALPGPAGRRDSLSDVWLGPSSRRSCSPWASGRSASTSAAARSRRPTAPRDR